MEEEKILRKVRKIIPKTKKAEILEGLARSPQTSKLLEKKGVIMSPQNRTKLKAAKDLLSSFKECIDETSKQGATKTCKSHSGLILRRVIMRSMKSQTMTKGMKTYFKIRSTMKNQKEWWAKQKRKQRKDRLSENVRGIVKSFFLSAEVSRQVPNKNDVMKVLNEGGSELVNNNHNVGYTMHTFE